jgi:5'-phosphate synthase pdxT subunit
LVSGAGCHVRVGVVALQGAFARHIGMLRRSGSTAVPVRTPEDLNGCDAVVLPGGESTTIGKLLDSSGLRSELADRLAAGLPALGTCAGLILLAREIVAPVPNDAHPFGAIDLCVRRNAFGRQVDSFEADLDVAGLDAPFHGVFIRAPWIESYGAGVEVLAWQNGHAVMARQGPVVVCSFHPELTDDTRIHALFVDHVRRGLG